MKRSLHYLNFVVFSSSKPSFSLDICDKNIVFGKLKQLFLDMSTITLSGLKFGDSYFCGVSLWESKSYIVIVLAVSAFTANEYLFGAI